MSLFSYKNMKRYMIRAQVEDTPAMRKRPKKLSSESLPDLETISCSLQSAFGRNHLSVVRYTWSLHGEARSLWTRIVIAC
ncbi:hypothetical protein Hanom_Chr08g00717741 [Helianthus anomalus]